MKMSHYLFKLSNLVDRKVTFLGIMKMDRYMFKLKKPDWQKNHFSG